MNIEELVEFIAKKFNEILDFRVQFNNIRVLCKKLDELSIDEATMLIQKSIPLTNTLKYLFNNISKNDKDKLVKEYFDNSIFASIFEAYCELNDLDITEWLNLNDRVLLSEEEITILVEKAQSGDIDARNIILEKNYGLVKFIANRYLYLAKSVDRDDLIQEGDTILLFGKSKIFRINENR